MVSAFRRKAAELSVVLQGQSPERIRDELDKLFADVRRQMIAVPEFLRLGESAAKALGALLATLSPEDPA